MKGQRKVHIRPRSGCCSCSPQSEGVRSAGSPILRSISHSYPQLTARLKAAWLCNATNALQLARALTGDEENPPVRTQARCFSQSARHLSSHIVLNCSPRKNLAGQFAPKPPKKHRDGLRLSGLGPRATSDCHARGMDTSNQSLQWDRTSSQARCSSMFVATH